jgi:hypothetical protein
MSNAQEYVGRLTRRNRTYHYIATWQIRHGAIAWQAHVRCGGDYVGQLQGFAKMSKDPESQIGPSIEKALDKQLGARATALRAAEPEPEQQADAHSTVADDREQG